MPIDRLESKILGLSSCPRFLHIGIVSGTTSGGAPRKDRRGGLEIQDLGHPAAVIRFPIHLFVRKDRKSTADLGAKIRISEPLAPPASYPMLSGELLSIHHYFITRSYLQLEYNSLVKLYSTSTVNTRSCYENGG